MRILIAIAASVITAQAWADCALKQDEEVQFYPAIGYRSVTTPPHWIVPLQGWVYEPQTNSKRLQAARSLFRQSLGLPESAEKNPQFIRRANAFLADNERSKELTIAWGADWLTLNPSTSDGRIGHIASLPPVQLPGWMDFETAPCARDARVFKGSALLLEPEGRMVVSDLDDTLKLSHVGNRERFLAATFLEDFQPIPGMADLLTEWLAADASTAFVYLSASPWPLFSELTAFLARYRFPRGVLMLKPFRWKDRTFFDLFGSPEKYKTPALEALFRQFPQRKFTLVGDAGEKDAEIFGALGRQFPKQVERVLIRDPQAPGDTARYERAFEGLPLSSWTVFRDPSELK
jgi:hypothetical protein